jgi:hypothetical protein
MYESEETYLEDEEEQFREYRDARSSFWISDRSHSDLLGFRRSATKWQLGPIFAERVFHDYDEPQEADISEASATCLATQIKGPNPGTRAILKIRKQ